ncbi:MAG TPA: glycosyltransferase [Ktedonobacteraceae bacterium]
MKHVCVGVHVHAEPERLLATLESLRKHTSQAIDILLLPDGPDDATKAVLDTLCDLPQSGTADPLGPPACFNRLANTTNAEVLILLESGALVGPGWLDYLLAALAAPLAGIAGPSTNRSWNEQAIFPQAGGTPTEVVSTARQAARWFGNTVRTLEPLHSLGDFCYAVRRDVVEAIGAADESYGLGPCWEMDYTIRAVRAGFRAVWACGAYVYRSPFTARRQHEEEARFEASRQRYQDKFCALRLRGLSTSYEPHCRGEACEHFAQLPLIQIRLEAPHVQKHQSGPQPDKYPVKEYASVTIPIDTRPLVSCIMPTRNRRTFVRQSLTYFERQDYPNKELVIVDDGDDQVGDLVASHPQVRYIALPHRASIGAKRNLACEKAHGAIIAHWDDDDWYAPHRLSHQVAPLLTGQGDLNGLETFCFFDLPNWQAWTCSPALHRRLFVGDVHGGTLVYWRRIWEYQAHYPDVSLAEDAFFLRKASRRGARLQKLPHAQSFVYLRHSDNAWNFPIGTYLSPTEWQQIDPNTCLPTEDITFYAALSAPAPAIPKSASMVIVGQELHPPTGSSAARAAAGDTRMPLVSCIMPTYNRRMYVPQAIRYFLRQDYPNCELIILDDGTSSVEDLIPSDQRIRYVRLDKRMILGAKRNLACELAHGSLIAHWDDDDWIAPHRLRSQVELLESQQADLCGASRQLYYKPIDDKAWLYEYFPSTRRVPIGNTLCYRKALWAGSPFPEITIGEDTRFIWSNARKNVALIPDHTLYIGLIHQNNTSQKNLSGPCWRPHSVEEIHNLLGVDLDFYRSVGILS